jgi:hypothetical protein
MQPCSRIATHRFAAALVAAIAATDLLAATAVPAPLQGKWVPSSGTCDSAVRMQVAATSLTLTNGSDSQTLGGIEMAGPGYFPPGYRGIEAVLITEFDAQQPVTVTFNADEKKGIARAEFAPVMPGNPTAQLKAYNARISQLNLAKRFPLNKVSLKKCA